MSQVFYRKWRPQTLSEVVGQEPVTRTLLNALAAGKVAHAYLFCGPRGTGKTSTGRILAKALSCLTNGHGEPCNTCSMCQAITEGRAMDLVEIDAASNTGVDNIRDLREKIGFAPNVARYKVYIVDEVHMLSNAAFNALLKTLEEPPPHAVFILATTETDKVPLTIISRCQRFDFRRVSLNTVVAKLQQVCGHEGITMDPKALAVVAKASGGSLRDAENLLEQIVLYHGSSVSLAQVEAELGLSTDQRVHQLAGHILKRNIPDGLATINSVSADGIDLRQFNRGLVDYLRTLLLIRAGAENSTDLAAERMAEAKSLCALCSLEDLSTAIKLFAGADFRHDSQSTLPLELALVDSCLAAAGRTELPASREKRSEAAAPAPVRPPVAARAPVRRAAEPPARPPVARPEPAVAGAPGEKPAPSFQGTTNREAKPPAATTPPPLVVQAPPGTIEHIQQRWKEFVDALRGVGSSGNMDALLRGSCRPLALEGDTLVLGFTNTFCMDKVANAKYGHLIENKLLEVFHAPYHLRCVVDEKEKDARAPKAAKPGSAVDRLAKAAVEMGARIIDEER